VWKKAFQMRTSFNRQNSPVVSSAADDAKAPVTTMTQDRKREVIAQLTDDVLSKLTGAFFDVCKIERWTKRDLSAISGINETAIGHILAGRRKNLTIETIALLARAMRVRPDLVFHNTRPSGNQMPPVQPRGNAALVLAARPVAQRGASNVSALDASGLTTSSPLLGSAESLAYAQPDIQKEAP
jgi:transcriptional regulator with XRE-family HTH domain